MEPNNCSPQKISGVCNVNKAVHTVLVAPSKPKRKDDDDNRMMMMIMTMMTFKKFV